MGQWKLNNILRFEDESWNDSNVSWEQNAENRMRWAYKKWGCN